MRARHRTALACTALLAAACASGAGQSPPPAVAPAASLTLPSASARPAVVEVCRPAGAIEALQRHGCPDGSAPVVSRRGTDGPRDDPPDDLSPAEWDAAADPDRPLAPGAADYHIVDLFVLTCGHSTTTVRVDVYHCQTATRR